MMNRSQQDRLLPRAKPVEPLAQSWGRPFQARKNGTQCACGGDCPRCLTGQAEAAEADAAAPQHVASASAETRTTTHPFKAEIRTTAPAGGSATGRSKTLSDGPGEEAPPAPTEARPEQAIAAPPHMREETPLPPPPGLKGQARPVRHSRRPRPGR